MSLTTALLVLVMQSGQDAALSARLDSIMRDAVDRYRLAGVSAAVVRGRDTLLNRGYGYAELGLKVPATATTRYRVLGPHLPAAVMQQVERGRVGLNDDVTRLITDFPWQGKRVTLRQLMDASSGLPDFHYLGDVEYRGIAMPKAPDEVTALVAGVPFTHEPGASWQWTITGFHLAGGLVEQLSGELYGSYLQKHIFAPAKLQQTHYCGDRQVVPELARTYTIAQDGYRYSPPEHPTSYPYIGTVCATASDAVKVMRAMRDGTLMKPESWRAMTTAEGAAARTGTPASRAIGLRINQEDGHRWVGETGTLLGFNSAVMDFAEDSLTIAVLSNTGTQSAITIARNLARAVFGLPPVATPPLPRATTPTEAQPLPAADRKKHFGLFETRRVDPPPPYRNYVRTFRVFEYNNRLVMQASGEEPEVLFHQGTDKFSVRGGQVTFTMEGGRAVAIEVAFGNTFILRGPRK